MPDDVNQAPAAGGGEPASPALNERIEHRSRVGELVPMHLKFLALTLLTLGIYHFWARTYARRFLWQRTLLLGDPFSYVGRPLELLVGFAIALVVVFGPIATINVLLVIQTGPVADAGFGAAIAALFAVQIVVVPYLVFVGGYAARRYRLSRTAWRGIRGAQSGSAWLFGLWGMGYAALTGLTAGWFYPWQRAKLARRRIEHSWFGSRRFVCTVAGRDLVGPFAIMWLGVAATLVVMMLVLSLFFAVLGAGALEGEDPEKFAWVANVAGPLLYAPAALFLLIYRAQELRLVARHTSFGDGVSFELTHTVWQYVGYALVNLLITLGTLGTGWIYLQRRQINFWGRYLVIAGTTDLAALTQAAETGPRTGEGLAELFDLGFEVGF